MGPPFATEVLRYALSICADRAVLLTDRKLGGADTPATAYPLSQSIRKIEKEIFGGDRDYLIITGMQSVDGDTAQVPPQVAEELGIPHVAYATSFRFAGETLQVARITRNGKEVVSPNSYPALITVTNWTEPPFASFSRTAWAYDQEIVSWSAADVAADPARIGLTGSRTTVHRIFSPKEVSTKNCVYVTDMRRLAEMVKQLYDAKLSSQAAKEEVGEQYRLPEDKTPTFRGEVWVYAEQDGGELHPAAFELLGRASSLAKSLKEKVAAVLLGAGVEALAGDLIAHGADKVYLAEHELLGHFSPMPYTETIGELIRRAPAADRAVRRHPAGAGTRPAGGLPDGFGPHRRLHRPGPDGPEACREGVHRDPPPDPAGARRQHHGLHHHAERRDPDVDGPPGGDAGPAARRRPDTAR